MQGYTGGNVTPPGTGQVVQVVNYQTGAVATGTTTIPYDDTIPQNTEGDEYMSLAITPTNVNNKLLIEVVWNGANSAAADGGGQVALFQDSIANALNACWVGSTGGGGHNVILRHYMTAESVSATTFKVRAGGTSGTTTFNGQAAGRKYGGVCISSITITEVRA